MKKSLLRSLLFDTCCGFCAFSAFAATSLFSDYGQIQNVQNYSSNPFWTPGSPYNQRMPQPVFVQGADLNTADCTSVVKSLVSVQCMARNNCKNTTLAEIRPTIMVQLSNLPGNNYVSACSGYLDGIFEEYVNQYADSLSNRQVGFPTAITPNQNAKNSGGVQISNPYKQQPSKWKQGVMERAAELKALQEQNGAGDEYLSSSDFPTTYADFSFTERMANDAAGLEPYKDMNAYRTLNAKTTEEWCKDGENATSQECMNYRCNEQTGLDANKPECITWRCSNKTYYDSHTDECERNKLCRTSLTSFECMQYRCYVDPDQNTDECKQWLCINDSSTAATRGVDCNQYQCDINNFANLSDSCKEYLCVTPGTYATNQKCINHLCINDQNYRDNNQALCSQQQNTPPNNDPTYRVKIITKEGRNENNRNVASAYGCFSICDLNFVGGGNYDTGTDLLNTKVLKPILDNTFCALQGNFLLVARDTREPLEFPASQILTLKQNIAFDVLNKGDCNKFDGFDVILRLGNIDANGNFIKVEDIPIDD